MSAGTMGMAIFLVTLGVLFAASMIGYLIVMMLLKSDRAVFDPTAPELQPAVDVPDLPPLPNLLILSTAIIIISSVTVQMARVAIRRGGQWGLRVWMVLTFLLASAFLALQTICWFEWVETMRASWETADDRAFRFATTSFLLLSGLHAAHVVGGLIPMLVVIVKSFRGSYSAESHLGVDQCARYWHFLDVVWLVMYGMLLLLA